MIAFGTRDTVMRPHAGAFAVRWREPGFRLPVLASESRKPARLETAAGFLVH